MDTPLLRSLSVLSSTHRASMQFICKTQKAVGSDSFPNEHAHAKHVGAGLSLWFERSAGRVEQNKTESSLFLKSLESELTHNHDNIPNHFGHVFMSASYNLIAVLCAQIIPHISNRLTALVRHRDIDNREIVGAVHWSSLFPKLRRDFERESA